MIDGQAKNCYNGNQIIYLSIVIIFGTTSA